MRAGCGSVSLRFPFSLSLFTEWGKIRTIESSVLAPTSIVPTTIVPPKAGIPNRRFLMKALVVHDSAFGNKERIALAMAKALCADAARVGDVKLDDLQGLDVFFVGSPTQKCNPLGMDSTWATPRVPIERRTQASRALCPADRGEGSV
jgi:hypothetical protein